MFPKQAIRKHFFSTPEHVLLKTFFAYEIVILEHKLSSKIGIPEYIKYASGIAMLENAIKIWKYMIWNVEAFVAPAWKRITEYDREKDKKLVELSRSSMLG